MVHTAHCTSAQHSLAFSGCRTLIMASKNTPASQNRLRRFGKTEGLCVSSSLTFVVFLGDGTGVKALTKAFKAAGDSPCWFSALPQPDLSTATALRATASRHIVGPALSAFQSQDQTHSSLATSADMVLAFAQRYRSTLCRTSCRSYLLPTSSSSSSCFQLVISGEGTTGYRKAATCIHCDFVVPFMGITGALQLSEGVEVTLLLAAAAFAAVSTSKAPRSTLPNIPRVAALAISVPSSNCNSTKAHQVLKVLLRHVFIGGCSAKITSLYSDSKNTQATRLSAFYMCVPTSGAKTL